MKILVCGSRDFSDFARLKATLCDLIDDMSQVVILSGCARGADSLGEKFAEENGIPVERFPADWNKFGRRAGFIRNKEMVDKADMTIAFHINHSRGTAHTIALSREKGILTHVEEVIL